MELRKLLLASSLFLLIAFSFQGPKPIEPYPGDDNPQHDGQPMRCQSDDRGGYLHNCACRAMEAHHCDPQNPDADDEPDVPTGRDSSQCKTYCRRSACSCASPCGG